MIFEGVEAATHKYVNIYIHAHIYIYAIVYVYVYVDVDVLYMYMDMHMHMESVYVCVYIYICICTCILGYMCIYHIILYDIIYYTILYYIILYYIIMLYYITLYYTTLYYIILHYIILYYIILCFTIFYFIILYYIDTHTHTLCIVHCIYIYTYHRSIWHLKVYLVAFHQEGRILTEWTVDEYPLLFQPFVSTSKVVLKQVAMWGLKVLEFLSSSLVKFHFLGNPPILRLRLRRKRCGTTSVLPGARRGTFWPFGRSGMDPRRWSTVF